MSDQNPICWGLLCSSGIIEVVTDTEQELIDYKATDPDDSEVIIPLYRHPQPTLTDEEREAIEWCLSLPVLDRDIVRMIPLRSLLERLK
jgi:hypothetical protein